KIKRKPFRAAEKNVAKNPGPAGAGIAGGGGGAGTGSGTGSGGGGVAGAGAGTGDPGPALKSCSTKLVSPAIAVPINRTVWMAAVAMIVAACLPPSTREAPARGRRLAVKVVL